MTSPFRQSVNTICESLPGAEWAAHDDGGLDAWKIGGKMFACLGSMDDGVSVKTPDVDTAAMLIDAGVGIKAPYFHKSWIRMTGQSDPGDLKHRLLASYDLVRGSLTKKMQNSLPMRESS